jgi:hypothetical protein
MKTVENPWNVPVRIEDVPEAGLQLALSADAGTREALARLAGVRSVSRLELRSDLRREGSRLRATGLVSATVGQTCVVSLEPMDNVVEEHFDLVFTPGLQGAGPAMPDVSGEEPPEPLVDGVADLGAVATEFLLLGIDPYPRKPGAVFASPSVAPAEPGPFAALAALKNRPKNQG